ncbi:MAG TPA: NAD-glutamate dehydrogenase domain-containing protein [Burkholderiales bacterium]|nr:NAD-glutamate dehydrogenase domain-containing protein [Burkholderiales bacterium]
MAARTDKAHAERLDQILALVREKLPAEARGPVEAFVRAYYRQVDPEDLAERSPADLYGAALSHWNFARRRAPGQARVRVFNPNVQEHGWESTHTIVEIVNDDMPFLVSSVTMEVNRHGLTLHLIVHPTMRVNRQGAEHTLTGVLPDDSPAGLRESFMHIEVDRITEPPLMETLAVDLERVLAEVRTGVEDWKKMIAKVRELVADLERRPPPIGQLDLAEARAFLAWLADNHFTFLGYRCHDLVVKDGDDALAVVPGSGLGILREQPGDEIATSFSQLPPQVRAYARVKDLLVLTKSNSRSTVHRPGYLDYIGVKRYDDRGEVCGEHRFLGLYTHVAYHARPADIPLLRRKVTNVQARAGFVPGGHAWKTLESILDTYPRDELFQISEDELFDVALGILHLGERQRSRLFVRRDPFERFLTCLIYAPRENYTTDLRRKWQAILMKAFNGTSSDFNAFLSESVLARIMITVRTTPGQIPAYDVRSLEGQLVAAARRWEDELREALVEAAGEARGNELYRRFGAAFPAAYREDIPARSAVPDCEMLAKTAGGGGLGMNLYKPLEAAPGRLRFKLFHKGGPVSLSDSLPMLERMGLRALEERPYRVTPEEGDAIWIHDFGLVAGDAEIDIDAVGAIFEEAFGRVFTGELESDDFNRLVLASRLSADEIVVLRAYAKYLRQTGFPLSQGFIEQTMAANPVIARMLVNLFKLRLDPEKSDDAGAAAQVSAIEQALDRVANLNEDRVLRQYLAVILATTRTDYWRRDADGRRRTFLSFKFDPSQVPGLPEPKPMFEICVYSTRFEGVHLRGGKVARGGLRWSDRPEDFRTEVLGLVKAQMVKNTVIVPVGSKGGFVLKRAPPAADREAYLKEGVACYKDYLRGLLDLTDNLVGGKVAPPPQVRRLDADDPYLVVAADKGTATFSDHANEVSKEYGFWLGDAFASGGSAGYDHKAMGITARGAWESVKRHFRELGIDTQTTDFTVVGIGDMSGDVFGNGMLLSKHIRLVAAFDHRHVFVDPDPDAASSWAERKRLFGLPRSSWGDYNAMLISQGGGVWPRAAKSISISPEARRALGIETESLAPSELINAILKAPVDLLYNGGIGTYVKSAKESHAEVGDRANDAIRVNGMELRCKVVAEGGNLGCTQLGRIEYALKGGRIFTDAIDNSAGVDTSDHEVNIKILLGLVIADGELTEKQRNTLLSQMTDQVAALVLRDNYFQTQSLSIGGRIAPQLLDQQQRFMQFLEKSGRLNRALEFLPPDEEIAERRTKKIGLTAPERAVLLAYSKMWLKDEFLAAVLPEDEWIATALGRYFPQALREAYAGVMPRHPLRREIIATHVVNSMVNRVGSTFVHRAMETTGAKPDEIVRAYLLTREVFGYVPLWQSIEALDNKVADSIQADMLIEAGRLIVRASAWFLRSRRLAEPMEQTMERFQPGVEALHAYLLQLLDAPARSQLDIAVVRWTQAGVPQEIALRVAALDTLYAALDIVEIAESSHRPVETVAGVYFQLSSKLGLAWLRDRISKLPGDSHWQTLAKGSMRDDLAGLQRTLAGNVLANGPDNDPRALVAAWEARSRETMERASRLLGELRAAPAPDLAMLSVGLRELRNLA